jgi:hypothetical protein
VRFETTPRFDRDFRDLKPEHQRQFRNLLPDFNAACDAYARANDSAVEEKTKGIPGIAGHRWPAALRVSPMKSAEGVWEMTWSFASPDGRATFEFVADAQGPILRWRRVGDHTVYKNP